MKREANEAVNDESSSLKNNPKKLLCNLLFSKDYMRKKAKEAVIDESTSIKKQLKETTL